jgi:hypothetical protein
MKDDPYMRMVETSLQFVSKLGDQTDQLAYALYRTLEGDDVGGFELLRKFGYTDENDEWIEE